MCAFKIILLAFCLFYWNQVRIKEKKEEIFIHNSAGFAAKGHILNIAGVLFFP
jgi:hypothetical protein